MSNKNKKNNVAVEWPSNTHFTMNDLFKANPDFIEITLRFRVKRALENKEIVTIGKVKPPIGRPQLVFSKANPSKELLETATKAGVLPLEDKKTAVTVAEVKTARKSKKTEATQSENVDATTTEQTSNATV